MIAMLRMIRDELLIVQQESYCITAAALGAALGNKRIFSPQLFVKIASLHPRPLIGRLSSMLASDWPGLTAAPPLVFSNQ